MTTEQAIAKAESRLSMCGYQYEIPRVSGATDVDKAAHLVFLAAGSDDTVRWRPSGVTCNECGEELETYYCEERLYAVRCRKCETVMLNKSRGSGLAAIRSARISREGAELHG